jgi:mycothiol synthase
VSEAIQPIIRRYQERDLAAVVALENLALRADGYPLIVTEEERRAEYSRPGFDPFLHVWVVDGPVAGLHAVGWMRMQDSPEADERVYILVIVVHPDARSLGLGRVLLDRLSEQIRSAESEAPAVSSVKVRTYMLDGQLATRKLYEDNGFGLTREHWWMACPLAYVDRPQPVAGITIRPYAYPADNPAAIEAYNYSFIDHSDFMPLTPERWEHRLNYARVDLSCVAEIDSEPGKLAGFCIITVQDELNRKTGKQDGIIDLLGTIRSCRGKGLGRSLLLYGLSALKAAGMNQAYLLVDAHSFTGANILYESVGFHKTMGLLQFEKRYPFPVAEKG